MPFTRRHFLGASATLAGNAFLPKMAEAQTRWSQDDAFRAYTDLFQSPGSPELKTLALRALDAAKGAGATYADVRFRSFQLEQWRIFFGPNYPTPLQEFVVGIGVRALVNGYWGFAGRDGIVGVEDVAQLGIDATTQAKFGALGPARTVEMTPVPPVIDGHWQTPIDIDPFTVSFEEKVDFIGATSDFFIRQGPDIFTTSELEFLKETRTVASTEGSFFHQTLYTTSGIFTVSAGPDWMTENSGARSADFLTPSGAGWEAIRNAPFRERADELIEEARRSCRTQPIETGRYDVVFDAAAMAKILDVTLAPATELDRAFGYDADGIGTSFITQPLTMAGTLAVASPLITIAANRSLPTGAATAQWDDEGVVANETVLVRDGILADFQTTRESASAWPGATARSR